MLRRYRIVINFSCCFLLFFILNLYGLIDQAKAGADFEILSKHPIYPYFNNEIIYDTQIKNADKLYNSLQSRVKLYIYEKIIRPQLQIKRKFYISKTDNTMEWKDDVDKFKTTTFFILDSFSYIHSVKSGDFNGELLAEKDLILDLYDIAKIYPEEISILMDMISSIVDAVILKGKFSIVDFTLLCSEKFLEIGSNVLASIQLNKYVRESDFINLVELYLDRRFYSAEDADFLMERYGLPFDSISKSVEILDRDNEYVLYRKTVEDMIRHEKYRVAKFLAMYNEKFGPFSDYNSGAIEIEINDYQGNSIGDAQVDLYYREGSDSSPKSSVKFPGGKYKFGYVITKKNREVFLKVHKEGYEDWDGALREDFFYIIPNATIHKKIILTLYGEKDKTNPEIQASISPCILGVPINCPPDQTCCYTDLNPSSIIDINVIAKDNKSGLSKLRVTNGNHDILYESNISGYEHSFGIPATIYTNGINQFVVTAWDKDGNENNTYLRAISGTVSNYVFSDVSDDDLYYNAIMELSQRGIVTGDGETGNFLGDEPLTRAHFSAMIYRAAKDIGIDFKDQPRDEWHTLLKERFVDVTSDDAEWYDEFMGPLADKDIIHGFKIGEKAFLKPDTSISRAEMLKIVLKLFYNVEIVENSEWYYQYMDEAIKFGIEPLYENSDFISAQEHHILQDNNLLMANRKEAAKAVFDAVKLKINLKIAP